MAGIAACNAPAGLRQWYASAVLLPLQQTPAGPSKLGCLVQVGNGLELGAVGLQFEPYRWRPCGVTWNSSRTVVVTKQ